MAFNGAGVFSRIYSWITDRNSGIKILASRMDAEMDGFATGLSNTICRDGQSTITQDIPFNNRKITGLANATDDADALNRITADGRYLQSIADGAVTTAKIADDAVTSAKIDDDAVTTAKIDDDAVTTAKIDDGSVTTAKIDDDAVTTAKIDDGSVTTAKIDDDAVTTAKIADANVTSAKLATAVVRGVAKAWANLNGTGTIALRDSLNVSSVADNGTGDYTFNFTTAMPDTNYVAIPNASPTGAPTIFAMAYLTKGAPLLTTSVSMVSYRDNGGSAGINDIEQLTLTVFS
jgi:hypothetical protein